MIRTALKQGTQLKLAGPAGGTGPSLLLERLRFLEEDIVPPRTLYV
jgi:hypothetical protein